MFRGCVLILLPIVLYACGAAKKTKFETAPDDMHTLVDTIQHDGNTKPEADTVIHTIDTLLSLQYGVCFGKCPVYSVFFLSDGQVRWIGIKNIEKIGHFNSTLDTDQLKDLKTTLQQSWVDVLAPRYPMNSADVITDFPTVQFTFKKSGVSKTCMINHSPPATLKNLEFKLQDLLRQLSWVFVSRD